MRTTVLAAVLVVLLVPAPVALAQDGSVPPGLGIGIAEVPTGLADDPRAHVYVVDTVDPGATFERRLTVSNGTDEPLPVRLYPTAASVEDGWAVAEGEEPTGAAAWITITPERIEVPAHGRTQVTARFRVPDDAPGGEHYGAIVAERPAVTQDGVAVIHRAAVRVYLAVTGSGGEAPTTDFEIDTLAPGRTDEDVPYVLVGLSNTGGRAIDATGELFLTDGPGGISGGPYPVSTARTIAPGGRGTVAIALDPGIPAGPWTARAEMRSGALERTAEATITFPAEPGTEAEPVDAVPILRDRTFLVPLAGGMLALAIALVAWVWWLVRRRRHEDDDAAATEPSTVDA